MSRWRAVHVVIAAAVVSGLAAMVLYPGGTKLDRSTTHYEVTQNFLSDLGMTVAYNGAANRTGATLFVVGLLLLVVASAVTLVPLGRTLLAGRASRVWATGAIATLGVTSLLFIGVAFTPENRAMSLHVAFTVWAFRLAAVLAVLFGVACLRSGAERRRAGRLLALVGIALAAYSALFSWGPSFDVETDLAVHVIAQKVMTVVILVSLLALRNSGRPQLAEHASDWHT